MGTEQRQEDLFKEMVKDITVNYGDDIKSMVAAKGGRPSFEELREKVLAMEMELIDRAVRIIETYKRQTGKNADELTDRFKAIITKAIEDFIKTL